MKRSVAFLLCLIMIVALCVPALADDEEPIGESELLAAETTYNNGSPYYIMVNRRMCCVTVFGLDEDEEYYSVPVKSMICSTGKPGEETPLGTYAMNDQKYRWCGMVDGSYAQYACAFWGNYMIHSVCYNSRNTDDLMRNEYNDLGTNVSLGCVRLQVADAKWVYDNCPVGTLVTIYESDDPGPLGRPDKKIRSITEEMHNGWDPTDPSEDNPWLIVRPESLSLNTDFLSLLAGSSIDLKAAVFPEEAIYDAIEWETSDPSVATVNNGRVIAMGGGDATITVSCGEVSAQCDVHVSGELLRFTDVIPGDWYYDYVRHAVSVGMFGGTGDYTFSPGLTMTRAMLVQVLYNISFDKAPDIRCPFDDVESEAWYYDAVMWAYSNGIVNGISATEFRPSADVSREQFAAMLYRYYVNYLGNEPLNSKDIDVFDDYTSVSGYAVEAVKWMYGNGIIEGMSEAVLGMDSGATRAQAAAMLSRWYTNVMYSRKNNN